VTDLELATCVRAIAADRHNPASVGCGACRVLAGAPCIETLSSGTPSARNGFHGTRTINARMTAEGAALRLLLELGDVAATPPT